MSARLSWGFWVGAGPGAAALLGGEGLEGGAGAPFWLLDDNMTSAGLLEPEILIINLITTIHHKFCQMLQPKSWGITLARTDPYQVFMRCSHKVGKLGKLGRPHYIEYIQLGQPNSWQIG